MKTLSTHKGQVMPLNRVNVDTDAILPKQFLKRVERTGYEKFLFHDWRYDDNGEENENFVLNDPRYKGASILLGRDNFGSGSSREHAPWALEDFGFRVLIAPSFAEIFYNNCFKNGILPIVLKKEEVEVLFEKAFNIDSYSLQVDVKQQTIRDDDQLIYHFDLEDSQQERLLKGMDDIEITMKMDSEIAKFEKERRSWLTPKRA
ncbi:3-isopropylmalate dehydratase small subunit [Alteribacillus sp. JSM 102045]|uniref:3-isopropylmalate dehydratase small subunit n=1 Tax=Alteribacillus sp. JSM 102045 TaxID=1562101 RepID=UPI0035C0BF14